MCLIIERECVCVCVCLVCRVCLFVSELLRVGACVCSCASMCS